MDGEMVLSMAERDGLNPKAYGLMLMETIERREREVGGVEKGRKKISEDFALARIAATGSWRG